MFDPSTAADITAFSDPISMILAYEMDGVHFI